MVTVTIRDVSAVSPEASVSGPAALRDDALEVAPRIAPPGSSVAQVAQIAAALILVGVGKNPTDHGLSLDAETLARAHQTHRAMELDREPPEARASRAEFDAHRAHVAAEDARARGEAVERELADVRARLGAETARADGAEQELAAARARIGAAEERAVAAERESARLRAEVARLSAAPEPASSTPAADTAPAAAQVEAPAEGGAAPEGKRRNR